VTDTKPIATVDNPRAIGLLMVAWLFFTAEIVAIKTLAGDIPVAQMLVLRFALQAVGACVFVMRYPNIVRTRRIGLHAARSLFSLAGMVPQYLAFGVLPLALATTLSFTQSLFLVALAAIVLRERIGPARGTTTIVGFLGVFVLCRPGVDAVDPMAFAMLGGSFAGALVMTTTKLLARTERPATIVLYVGLFNTLATAIPAWIVWQTPTAEQTLLLIVICATGLLAHVLMTLALRIGDAAALAPVDYVRLVFATIAGYLLFAEIPDIWTWLGAAIILCSTLALARSERRARVP
jgi:drug/metabolite transporter (DMT)-like permease